MDHCQGSSPGLPYWLILLKFLFHDFRMLLLQSCSTTYVADLNDNQHFFCLIIWFQVLLDVVNIDLIRGFREATQWMWICLSRYPPSSETLFANAVTACQTLNFISCQSTVINIWKRLHAVCVIACSLSLRQDLHIASLMTFMYRIR
jgi:hypothetical protein